MILYNVQIEQLATYCIPACENIVVGVECSKRYHEVGIAGKLIAFVVRAFGELC